MTEITTTTISTTVAGLRSIAALSVFAGSKDIAPILASIHLEVASTTVRATATDRYTAGTFLLGDYDRENSPIPVRIEGEPVDVNLPADEFAKTVKLLGTTQKALAEPVELTIEQEDGKPTAWAIARRYSGEFIEGQFPNVLRLFPSVAVELKAGVTLSAEKLVSLHKLEKTSPALASAKETARNPQPTGWRFGAAQSALDQNRAPVIATHGPYAVLFMPLENRKEGYTTSTPYGTLDWLETPSDVLALKSEVAKLKDDLKTLREAHAQMTSAYLDASTGWDEVTARVTTM